MTTSKKAPCRPFPFPMPRIAGPMIHFLNDDTYYEECCECGKLRICHCRPLRWWGYYFICEQCEKKPDGGSE